MPYPYPPNEHKRLEALARYSILDTPAEQSFDDLTIVASTICGTPIALMTLVDENRQWIKAGKGLQGTEIPREQAFCAYTIMNEHVMVVEDATKDERFASNPLVTGDPNIRFYAGAPLIDRDGHGLGALCIIDRVPRHLQPGQCAALEALARRIMAEIELRGVADQLAEALRDVSMLQKLIPICSHCKGIRDDAGYWSAVETYVSEHTGAKFSHGVCPDCVRIHYPDMYEEWAAMRDPATV